MERVLWSTAGPLGRQLHAADSWTGLSAKQRSCLSQLGLMVNCPLLPNPFFKDSPSELGVRKHTYGVAFHLPPAAALDPTGESCSFIVVVPAGCL